MIVKALAGALLVVQVAGCEAWLGEEEAQIGPGDPEKGKVAIRQYACISCHTIQGVVGPDVRVGPPLRNFSQQKYIAGVLPNTFENLVLWIREPQEVIPLSAMPDMGVKDEHARDIAAYLYSAD